MSSNLKIWAFACLGLALGLMAYGVLHSAPEVGDPGFDPALRLVAPAGAALAIFVLVFLVAVRRFARELFAGDSRRASLPPADAPGAPASAPASLAGDAPGSDRHPYATLFVASFVALFVEVMLIRYASSQIRIFAYYKNVPLVAAFLGLGLGCCQGRGRARHALLFLLWLVPLAAAFAHGTVAIDQVLDRWTALGSSEHVLGYAVSRRISPLEEWAVQLAMGLFCAATFAAVAALFTLLGRLLGEAFERVPRLPAYSANLLGSLAGILAFLALCYFETPPWTWFAVGLLPLLWWTRRGARAWVALALVGASVLVVSPSAGETVWSRYQKLVGRVVPAGAGTRSTAYILHISDFFYQVAVDLRPEAIRQLGWNPYPHYDAAFRMTPRRDRVLIVGAGTGNDVAAALRAGARAVDAVDIDPAIVRLGRLHHPEHPYDDPRVKVIVDDARRAFRYLEPRSYDVVVFGLLDSHTQLGISSVRLDNYVFTLESLAAARRLLRPGGSLVITAVTFRWWFRDRFAAMVAATCDTPVTVFVKEVYSTYGCQVDDPSRPPRGVPVAAAAVLPVDDWPFLYLPDRRIPRAYLIVLLLLAVTSWAVLKGGGLELGRFNAFDGHLFFLGAAFLLMEVYAINRLALLFGTTWLVSAVTIAVVLVLVVAANLTVALGVNLPYPAAYAAVIVALLGGYFTGPETVLGHGTGPALAYALLLLAPVYFAGLIFSRSFARSAASGPAIGVNILGSVVGGWTEYSTMAVGIRALALIALLFYLASWLMQQRAAGPEEPAFRGS